MPFSGGKMVNPVSFGTRVRCRVEAGSATSLEGTGPGQLILNLLPIFLSANEAHLLFIVHD